MLRLAVGIFFICFTCLFCFALLTVVVVIFISLQAVCQNEKDNCDILMYIQALFIIT